MFACFVSLARILALACGGSVGILKVSGSATLFCYLLFMRFNYPLGFGNITKNILAVMVV